MAFMLLIIVRVFFLMVTAGSLIDESVSYNISLGSSLTPDKNPSWFSPSGLFAFGFYRQDDGFQVGISLTSKPNITVVWTANRDDPPLSSNSSIELTVDGWLLLHTTDGEKNITTQMSSATSGSMFDSGNFVLYNQSIVVWESFANPCDTILGGQKLEDRLVSSVSDSHHSSGRFELIMQYDGNLVAYPKSSLKGVDDSYWSSNTFFGVTLNLSRNGSLYVAGHGTLHSIFSSRTSLRLSNNKTVVYRATLNPHGNFILYSHIFTTLSSSLTGMKNEWAALQDVCSAKGVCGINSYCSITAGNPECQCFPGFLFFNSTVDGKFLGCYRNFTDEEACSRREVKLFYNITVVDNIELGIYPYSVMNISKKACSKSCLDDCNCWVAVYANGMCKMLKVPIIYAVHSKSNLITVFIKTSSLIYQAKDPKTPLLASTETISVVVERKKLVAILAITLAFLAILCTVLALYSFFFYRMHAHRYRTMSENADYGLISDHFTLRSFTFDELLKVTNGFMEPVSRSSIGEVYKGFISDGKKAVAVKKLHRMFEGEGGFRAEITAIAQTHHRNLVRLLGFCIHGATKLLVYEFMSNGSLADLLCNSETQPGWKERVRVALDVAKGILYLHEECETRIIHCNVKPHNILFDESWTAKISDFGVSKLLRPNLSGTLTGVRGTRGYQAPEWQKNTLISTKVDIYSFGVLLLEILCCTSDIEIDVSSDEKILLFTWVYNCFVTKKLNRLIGDLDEEVDINMCEKMVKVGLLCIQDDPDARPSIKDVILMLEGTTDIPTPPSPTSLSLI
ncbi:S-locus glycoprotein domain-containing protein [Artemisia annua]|uniref:Receptor-like serine/threonine-protein kinase n=1 Tax=Artemisia annua TaxID=35608 RepID=A0A2U1PYE2_ARTAN|nr:S-locus glycoprotein domain-containing protein [Artemisia annua]